MRRAPRSLRCLLLPSLLAVALGPTGCKELPEIPTNECGNAIVEGAEECDSYVPAELLGACRSYVEQYAPGDAGWCDALACGKKGEAGECRFVHGAESRCPPGYGAGADGICRLPGGEFDAAAPLARFADLGLSVRPLDVDGDGRDELLGTSIFGTEAIVAAFDASGGFVSTTAFPSQGVAAVGRLTGPRCTDDGCDTTDDLVVGLGVAIGTFVGSEDAALRPKLYASVELSPSDRVLAIPYPFADACDAAPGCQVIPPSFVTQGLLTENAQGVARVVRIDIGSGQLNVIGTIPGLDIDSLVGEPTFVELDAARLGPELVLLTAEGDVHVVNLGDFAAGDELVVDTVPGAPIDFPAASLVPHDGGSELLFVRFVDQGEWEVLRLAAAPSGPPPAPRFALEPIAELRLTDDTYPVAVGYLNGDDLVDVVTLFDVRLSLGVDPVSGKLQLATGATLTDFAPWEQARFLPQGEDGLADLVALSSRGIDVLLAATDYSMNRFRYPLDAGAVGVESGDFDGDGVRDLLVVEGAQQGPEGVACPASRLYFAGGNASGPPDDLVEVGRLAGIEDSVVGRLYTDQSIDGVEDVGVRTVCEGTARAGIALGSPGGSLLSPFFLQPIVGSGIYPALGVAIGDFPTGGVPADGRDDLALLGWRFKSQESSFVLLGLSASGEAELAPSGLPVPLEPFGVSAGGDPENLGRIVPALDAADLDGEPGDELVVFGPTLDALGKVTGDSGELVLATLTVSNGELLTKATSPVPADAGFAGIQRLRLADVDGDGHLDALALALSEGPSKPLFYRGTGGAFADAIELELAPLAGFEGGSTFVSDVLPLPPRVELLPEVRRTQQVAFAVTSCATEGPDAFSVCSFAVVSCSLVEGALEGCEPVLSSEANNPRQIGALATSDLDGDGFEDLVVSEFFRRTSVFRRCPAEDATCGRFAIPVGAD